MNRRGPFPGMDPWLESRWEGVHTSFIVIAQEKLNEQLPDDLIARVDERVFVGYADGDSRSVLPDVFVSETGRPPAMRSAAMAIVDEPVLIRFADEPVTEVFINIVTAGDGEKIITAIELLNLTNKSNSHGRKQYLRKREEYHRSGVSVVEIDLLRQGRHLVDVPPGYLREPHLTPYKVCVRRGWNLDAREAEFYAIPLRSPLPRIRIPLRQGDPDAALDLQHVLDSVYMRGRYDRTNYHRAPNPSLNDDDMTWGQEQIKQWQINAPTLERT